MAEISERITSLQKNIERICVSSNRNPADITIIGVTKTKSVEKIQEAYNLGLRDLGENRVQELIQKYPELPKNIRWHFIGHLQKNKVKLVAPFVYLIHSIDSMELLEKINEEAKRNSRIINCLLEIKIAKEETKYGISPNNLEKILSESKNFPNITIQGLMGMATFTDDKKQIKEEFFLLGELFQQYKAAFGFTILSMGMSSDYEIAIACGTTHIRIGTLIFGER